MDSVGNSGVWMRLNLDGSLEVVKTSGDLEAQEFENGKVIIGSDLNVKAYPEAKETEKGWIRFDKHGKYQSHRLARPSISQWTLGAFPKAEKTGLKGFLKATKAQNWKNWQANSKLEKWLEEKAGVHSSEVLPKYPPTHNNPAPLVSFGSRQANTEPYHARGGVTPEGVEWFME